MAAITWQLLRGVVAWVNGVLEGDRLVSVGARVSRCPVRAGLSLVVEVPRADEVEQEAESTVVLHEALQHSALVMEVQVFLLQEQLLRSAL